MIDERYKKPFHGKHIRACRRNANITQNALAAALGVSPTNVSGWENQTRKVPEKYNMLICEVLNRPPEMLYLQPPTPVYITEDRMAQTPRLSMLHDCWHLIPVVTQRIIIDIATQAIDQCIDLKELLNP